MLKKLLKIFIYGFLLWYLIHISYTIFDGLRNSESNADVAIVMGNKVNVDGSLSKDWNKD